MDDNQPVYFSYSTPSTEVFDFESIVETCNRNNNTCFCDPPETEKIPKFIPITVFDDECNAEVPDINDCEIISSNNDTGIECEFIIVNGKQIFKQLTIPFYCKCDDKITYNQLAYTFPNYIVAYSQENYFAVDKIHEFDDYVIFSLNFFSDSNLYYYGCNEFKTDKQLRMLYYNCNVVCKTKDKVLLLRRQGFDTLGTTPYLWERDKLKLKELECNEDGNIIIQHDKFEETYTFPTVHCYTNNKCFQPTLYDIFCQIPYEININEPFLVTTEMISNNPNIIIQGDYHVGKTTIYTIVPEQCSKKRKVQA